MAPNHLAQSSSQPSNQSSSAIATSKSQTSKPHQPATSQISPWLTPAAYWLGNNIVFPAYFGNIRVTGQHYLPRQGPVILAPLHKSRWDALMVPYAAGRAVTGRDLRFMVSASEVRGLQGWFIHRLGGFPIDQSRPGISSLRHGVELLGQGEVMVIFPEGGIFRDREVHSLKPGLARLALQAQSIQTDQDVQIVPISIAYDPVIPHWGCDVEVNIGKPLNVRHYQTAPAKQAAQQLTVDLRRSLDCLLTGKQPIEAVDESRRELLLTTSGHH